LDAAAPDEKGELEAVALAFSFFGFFFSRLPLCSRLAMTVSVCEKTPPTDLSRRGSSAFASSGDRIAFASHMSQYEQLALEEKITSKRTKIGHDVR
jgi:hypothetical protein